MKADPVESTRIESFPSDLGWIAVAATDWLLLRLAFGYRSAGAAKRALSRIDIQPPGASPRAGRRELDLNDLADRLQRFAEGEPVEFGDVPIDQSNLTPLSRKVIAACRQIRWGDTTSYGELAKQAGRPGAARAVGSVMAKNRVPLVVPCHRVLGAGGKLGGYSAPEGLTMKRRLLALERSF